MNKFLDTFLKLVIATGFIYFIWRNFILEKKVSELKEDLYKKNIIYTPLAFDTIYVFNEKKIKNRSKKIDSLKKIINETYIVDTNVLSIDSQVNYWAVFSKRYGHMFKYFEK